MGRNSRGGIHGHKKAERSEVGDFCRSAYQYVQMDAGCQNPDSQASKAYSGYH